METQQLNLRDLPSVDRLLGEQAVEDLVKSYGRTLTVQAIRGSLDSARNAVRQGESPPGELDLIAGARSRLESWLLPTLIPVINATGVIIHTNLGRAPLSRSARQAMVDVASGYSNLEYDVAAGMRGKRELHAEDLLIRLTGAEAALVVNNNAAAILLALTALARGKEVVVSRTQLIEIGGGFRIPDIMKQSGASLREVGTTNRTNLQDFDGAINEQTALILRVHQSNFKIVGFSTEPSLSELVALAGDHNLHMLDDLGSGALLDTSQYGLGHEPMVQESVLAGAPLVAFSGDKLLGGPQSGILVGKRAHIERLKVHPMARAVRSDKVCLAALSATLVHYLAEGAVSEIPVWAMIAAGEDALKSRAETWRSELGQGELVPGRSTIGGGSLPEETLPTWLLGFELPRPNAFAGVLREQDPPIIARVEHDRVVIDPRTVLPDQEEVLITGVQAALEDYEN